MPEPVPVVVLGRLAVDAGWASRGIGRDLLKDAILRTVRVAGMQDVPQYDAVMSILKVRVGGSVEKSLARFGETLTKAKSGRSVTPYFGVGFRTMAQFGEVFNPKR